MRPTSSRISTGKRRRTVQETWSLLAMPGKILTATANRRTWIFCESGTRRRSSKCSGNWPRNRPRHQRSEPTTSPSTAPGASPSTALRASQRRESNPQPPLYKSGALPLSYAGISRPWPHNPVFVRALRHAPSSALLVQAELKPRGQQHQPARPADGGARSTPPSASGSISSAAILVSHSPARARTRPSRTSSMQGPFYRLASYTTSTLNGPGVGEKIPSLPTPFAGQPPPA